MYALLHTTHMVPLWVSFDRQKKKTKRFLKFISIVNFVTVMLCVFLESLNIFVLYEGLAFDINPSSSPVSPFYIELVFVMEKKIIL